ncbi:MAG: adenylyltransferase/cytidyltransferase family protein [bacterium]|nr:adenylyltransferase/cytidyltransferase family protein [bacterium]
MHKTVLAFGTFDGLHDGHRSMLSQARSLADRLVVAVPPDINVMQRKGHFPNHIAQIRQLLVQAEDIADEVVYADKLIGKWKVLDRVKPDIVAIGYDQIEMERSLRKFIKENNLGINIVVLDAYKPSELHNSLLKTK